MKKNAGDVVFERIVQVIRGEEVSWPADTDWDAVITIARRHGVLVMLAHRVPHEALRAAALRATERAMVLTRQLRALVQELTAAGIEVLPIKGPVLAATAYGDPARRGASGDLDLVLRRRDFDRALACLFAAGYTRNEGPLHPDHEHEQWESEAHLFPPVLPGTMVELHTELIGNFHTEPVELDAVLSRAHTKTLFGVPMLVPAAEDLLLYLCLHGARHFWSRLLWVCDLDAIVRSEPSIDWEALQARAASIHATHRLALGLHLARTLLGTPLPPLPALIRKEARLERHRTLAMQRMAEESAGSAPALGLRFRSELAARETLADRVTYVWKQLTPTARDRAWLALPGPLRWLRVVLRPVRLLVRYGQAYEKRLDPPR